MGDRDNDAETLALRHQIMVRQRQLRGERAWLTWADRAWLAAVARPLPRGVLGHMRLLVRLETVLGWHRDLIARRWTYPHTTSDPRALGEQVVALVLRLARENPRWGFLRIVGEARKLGVQVSVTSVRGILRNHRLGPAAR